MTYYYLVSSLPEIQFGELPALSLEQFCFQCSGVLTEQDFEDLGLVLEGRAAEGRSSFSQKWDSADTQIRNSIARYRAASRSADVTAFIKDHSGAQMFIEVALQDAFSKDNPLEQELAIDRCRWYILDELALGSSYGTEAVLAYALKLEIAQRWAALDQKKGHANFNEYIEANLSEQGYPTRQ